MTLVGDDNVHTTAKVHRLVLLAFVGEPPDDKPNALHRDDDPANNCVENLYWGTRSENTDDSVRNGSHVQARKATCALGHDLVAPNLVPSTTKAGGRSCLACKMAMANHLHDQRLRAQGRQRTRFNRGKDGFQRRAGEAWEDEAHRRYRHIMGVHAFGRL
ncbi:HNH endonuclease [Pseudonocardia asaccharolytica]|uniref:HNH endonuclease n=1 Tax=Pseudonocardia asaccharolytica TaxID=54010 RepID=UPI0003FD9E54|nr:HNH endonuclease [Pseudonocardia asaccharolytica]